MFPLLVLLACGGGEPPATVPPPEAPKAAPAPVARRDTLSWAALPKDDPAPPASSPRAYDQQVLVILSSSLEPGARPAGLDAVRALEGASPARLDSTWYKGLMPCYEIVVAGGFADIEEAKALSTRLAAAGIDHYLKRAGAYVGDRPELAGTCALMRAPAQGDARFAFVEAPGARLPLDAEVEARVLSGAPEVKRLDEFGTAWSAPLPVQAVDRWKKGEALPGLTFDGEVESCTIEGFAVGVTGTPHFGWQEGDKTSPGCGEPHVYAQLDCAADLVMAVGSKPGAIPAQGEATEGPPPIVPEGWAHQVETLRATAQAAAAERGTPWSERWTTRTFRVGGAEVRLVSLEQQSGEGDWICGQDDHYARVVGIVGPKGEPLSALFEATGWTPAGLVDTQGDGKPAIALREDITGSVRILSDHLDVQMAGAYCDCAC